MIPSAASIGLSMGQQQRASVGSVQIVSLSFVVQSRSHVGLGQRKSNTWFEGHRLSETLRFKQIIDRMTLLMQRVGPVVCSECFTYGVTVITFLAFYLPQTPSLVSQ